MNENAVCPTTFVNVLTHPFGGALHEIHARPADAAACLGFGLGAAEQVAAGRTGLLIGLRLGGLEAGWPYGAGVNEYGLGPADYIVVRARGETEALQAALEGARCAGLGAVLIEMWGRASALDLTTTRRLALGCETSGVQVFLLRLGDEAIHPTAAYTRWRVTSAPSQSRFARAPGAPRFVARLERHRGGCPQQTFLVEWDRDARQFRSADAGAALSRPVAALSVGRKPAETERGIQAGMRARLR